MQAYFPLVPFGKVPAIQEWQNVAPGVYPAAGNYGIGLGDDDFIFDADPRNYPTGTDVMANLLANHKLPDTRVVKTPRGGYHFYFKKPAHLKFRKKQVLFPGIDFLSAGAYIVGPGSTTPDGVYKVIVDRPVAELPESFLNLLEQYADRLNQGADGSLQYKDAFKLECETLPPAIEGQNGDATTYQLACRGRDLALPQDVTYELMRDWFNPRCLPPWGDAELFRKVENAYQYAKNVQGAHTAEAKFTPDMAVLNAIVTTPEPNVVSMQAHRDEQLAIKTDELQLKKNNDLENTAANVWYLFKHDAAWSGRFRFNEFSSALEFSSRPPWRERQMNVGLGLEKRDLSMTKIWLSSRAKLEVAEATIVACMEAAAVPYHPVRDYLDSLKWDGVPRLDSMLAETTGADLNAYTAGVGRAMMIGAVKRIYEPGCKYDYVPVLEGKQGTGKSTWIKTLGGDFFSASELVRGDKDTYQNLRGRWFVELPEINATFRKADFAWLKGVITNASDTYRASFGRTSQTVPRESVFVGSINPNTGGEYLKDDENRRYWPIKTRCFNIRKLKLDRDQLFAEAVTRYMAGEQPFLQPEVEELAKVEQAVRQEKDPWLDILADWCAGQSEGFTPLQVYAALGFNCSQLNGNQRGRLYSALHSLGYEHIKERGTGGRWYKTKTTWEDLL